MEKFDLHAGKAAPLLRNNVDTDAIIPSREMRSVTKHGLAEGLFSLWRYTDQKRRDLNPDFVLNKPEYADASILISGDNFGCGSSREHAVWALKEYGFRCIIAESFGSIFYRNCFRNGLLPIKLTKPQISTILSYVNANPSNHRLTIDLTKNAIQMEKDNYINFGTPVTEREMLLQGLDPISATQALLSKVTPFYQLDSKRRPWMYE